MTKDELECIIFTNRFSESNKPVLLLSDAPTKYIYIFGVIWLILPIGFCFH